MVSLALLVVWLITLPDSPPVHQANLGIWAVFLVDYLIPAERSRVAGVLQVLVDQDLAGHNTTPV